MKLVQPRIAAVLSILSLCLLSGCSQQTINSANQDASRDASAVSKSLQQAGQEVAPKLKAAGTGARVLAALRANENLPSTIRVDASPNGVRLRGTVHTASQKHLAGEIAKQTLGSGQSVSNQLTVASG